MSFRLTPWDLALVAGYFVILIVSGLLFSRSSKDASDYFRGGGKLVWWVVGFSAIMSVISSWSLIAGAAKVYADGIFLPLTLWIADGVGLIMLFAFAHLFRRMRVITAAEGIRRRFGTGTEQFVAWMQMLYGINYGGVMLYTLSIFVASVSGLDLVWVIVGVGIIVGIMSVSGGTWATSGTDFLQGLILVATIVILIVKLLANDAIGGADGFLERLPERTTTLTHDVGGELVGAWILMVVFGRIFNDLSIGHAGVRLLGIKDESHLRKMILWVFVPYTLLGMQFLLHVPTLASTILIPDIAAMFPGWSNPEEAAFVGVSMLTLPTGMMGLVLCAVFAASISSLDTAVNRGAGTFVRNVYARFLRPEATDAQQLRMAKVVSASFCALVIAFALGLEFLRDMNLFYLTLYLGMIATLPISLGLGLGLIFRRTPGWSGWSTMLVTLVVMLVVKFSFEPSWLAPLLGDEAFSKRERLDWEIITMNLVAVVIGTTWFLLTHLGSRWSGAEHRERLAALEQDLATPVVSDAASTRVTDREQYLNIGAIVAAMGGLILLGTLIPNSLGDRMLFLVTGLAFLAMGFGLRSRAPA